jgi:hypothetical protein
MRGSYWVFGAERDNLEDPGVDERIILRWIFRNLVVGQRLNRSGPG